MPAPVPPMGDKLPQVRSFGGHTLKSAVEALAFWAFVTIDIWFFVKRAAWSAALPLPFMIWSWRTHRRPAESLGFRFAEFRRSARFWWPLWLASLTVVAVLAAPRLLSQVTLRNAALYFLWSCLQQLALQSMIYLPLREGTERLPAAAIAGILFALVHAPNPVLMPGTLIWGALAAWSFEEYRSIWALGLSQMFLSSLLLQIAPHALSRGFRIGPFY
ncbi:MAG: CPBP family intramembrane metalloprotease [Acidobacteriota bacterium]|nr:CPBP family intramembrane metalloprotease [Acidobacteriota bacterium]